MKTFLKYFFTNIPFAIGIVFSLLSIGYVVKVINQRYASDETVAAIIFGIIGFSLVIASLLRIKEKNK